MAATSSTASSRFGHGRAGRDDAAPGLGRAVEVFEFEARGAGSPMVERVWQTRSAPEASFISVAASHWEMVVTRQDGAAALTLLGPETRATTASIPEDAVFLGVQFSLGTFMPGLPPGQLVDRELTLPLATKTSVRLDGYRLELPRPDDVDVFVAKLVRVGLLVHDPVPRAALQGAVQGLSPRSVQRRVARATGLTHGGIRQIRRAELAVKMLSDGVAPLDVAYHAGYADQAHLTRSLRRFVGQTPGEIAASPSRR
jgi:AraC-like DNA-binding protein